MNDDTTSRIIDGCSRLAGRHTSYNVSELLRSPADAPWIEVNNALYTLVSAPDEGFAAPVHGAVWETSVAIKNEILESVQ